MAPPVAARPTVVGYGTLRIKGANDSLSRVIQAQGGKPGSCEVSGRPGKLKRLDSRVDELSRDAAFGVDRFRPAATGGPAEQAHGCQSSAGPPPPGRAYTTAHASGSFPSNRGPPSHDPDRMPVAMQIPFGILV